MNIGKRTITVEKYVMELSEEEVADAIKNPAVLVRELKRVSGNMALAKHAVVKMEKRVKPAARNGQKKKTAEGDGTGSAAHSRPHVSMRQV